MIDIDKEIKRMNLVITETENDVKEIEGKPFTAKVVAEYHGYQSAAIVTMAGTMKLILEALKEKQ